MTARVIYCETTGTDAAVVEVIEIASVDMLADGGITNRQDVLVCPTIPVPEEVKASAVYWREKRAAVALAAQKW